MKTNKITEKIYHSIYPFTVKVEDFTYDWGFESVRINQAVVGYICARGINNDFSDEDREKYMEQFKSRIINGEYTIFTYNDKLKKKIKDFEE